MSQERTTAVSEGIYSLRSCARVSAVFRPRSSGSSLDPRGSTDSTLIVYGRRRQQR